MTDKINEQISAFMDGELSAPETPLLLKRLCHDKEASGSWQRYHLVSDVLNKRRRNECLPDISQQVMAVIGNESASQETIESSNYGVKKALDWKKAFSGMAIAASVAVVTFAFLPSNQLPETDVPIAANVSAPVTAPVQLTAAPVSAPVVQTSLSDKRELKKFMVLHAQHEGNSGLKGPSAYARLIRTNAQ